MPIVVTGAAGFIGSRLALALQNRGVELLLVDHPLTESKAPNLQKLRAHRFLDHQQFLEEVEKTPENFETIFHMGACSSTLETKWEYLEQNNLIYSQKLWKSCARAGTRLIYASSAATYGDGEQGFDDEAPIENLKPLNLYGRSKHDFDLWVQNQVELGNAVPLQSVGLKFFNVWGPGESHKGRMASVAWHSFGQILETGQVKLFQSHRADFSHGGQKRDFIYVEDIVRAMIALWERPETSGLFNLGTGRATTFLEYAQALFVAMGREPNIEFIPMPLELRPKYQYFTEAKMEKLRKAGVPFQPTALQTAMNEYVAFLQEERHAVL